MLDLRDILERAAGLEATTVHLRAGTPPVLRVHEKLVRLELPGLTDEELFGLARSLLSDDQQREFERDGEIDFLYRDGQTSYKANYFRVVDGHGLVLKRIASSYPTPEELGLPSFLEDFLGMRSGLILLTGPIGCGKTTTQTALLQKLNRERDLHVMTVEDPIEFVLIDGHCLIQQCEVGPHVASMAEGVELARKIRPDLLIVSEANDHETVDAVLQSAEGGMLVVASVHASSVTQAIAKLEKFFDSRDREVFRHRMAEVLRVVACQVLVHKQYGSGVVPVFEVLTNTEEVRAVISGGSYPELRGVMEKNRGLGMSALDDALFDLVTRNRVLVDEAVVHAMDKDRFESCRKLPQIL